MAALGSARRMALLELLSLFRLLPFRQESETLRLVEIFQQRFIDRNGPRFVTDQLCYAFDRRFPVYVRSKGVKVSLVGDDVLATPRQEVVEKKLAGIRIFGVL